MQEGNDTDDHVDEVRDTRVLDVDEVAVQGLLLRASEATKEDYLAEVLDAEVLNR